MSALGYEYEIFFDESISRRISCLDKNLIDCSDKGLHIIEKEQSGFADIALKFENPCIGFKNIEKNSYAYFNHKNVADYLLFERKSDTWYLHIFELKKTVKEKEWLKIKEQFLGGLLNGVCLAGFLGISLDKKNIILYTAYRNDRIKNTTNPLSLRADINSSIKTGINAKEKDTDILDWLNGEVVINTYESFVCRHIKIQLDEATGKGSYNF